MAKKFANAVVNAAGEGAITTYIHIFVYHVGFFLEKYGTIEKFANYGVEGTIRRIKKIKERNTNGFSLVGTGKKDCTYQEIAGVLRESVYHRPELDLPKSYRKDWSTERLEGVPPELQHYVYTQ